MKLLTKVKRCKNYKGLCQLVVESGCKRCKLCKSRTNIVFSRGDYKLPVMLVGEAPGKNEDEQGNPFVGISGKRMDRVFLDEIGYDTNEGVVTNGIMCRPPNNRDPELVEHQRCFPFLKRQLELLKPKIVVLLGKSALKCVVRDEHLHVCSPVGRFVGKLVTKVLPRELLKPEFAKHKLYVVNHPAFMSYGGGEKDYRKSLRKLGKMINKLRKKDEQ